MLKMSIPDRDCKLLQMKWPVFTTLVQKLKEQEAWRKLASTLRTFTSLQFDFSEENLKQQGCPATAILTELHKKDCRVRNLLALLLKCELLDAAAVLSEPRPLVIEEQPADISEQWIPYGGELFLKIVATGIPPPRYLWYCDNEELTDQRMSELQIPNFGPQHVGEYKCLVSQETAHGNCEIYSIPVNVLMVPEPPFIQEQPEPASVRVGNEVVMSCKAVSYPPPTYEWMRDNTVLVGENNPILKISHASLADSGLYKCFVSNGYNIKVTEAVKLSVHESPVEQTCRKAGLPIVTEKVALLIANAAYAELSGLRTPYSDVKALSSILKDLGFKVLALCDLTLTEMINAVKSFCSLIPEGAYAIFYFAGHGFELHDKYMLPVECPSPSMYRRSDSLCERHVIKEVLAKKPNLLLLMLDMCLKVPKIDENPGMFDEQVVPIPYDPHRNLIQAYATTSNLGAYERTDEPNGIYMKHMLKFLSDDMPIVDILQKVILSVSEEGGEAVNLQMPSLTTNVVPDRHYLTVPARENPETKELFDELTQIPNAEILYFPQIRQWSPYKFYMYKDCFHNAIEIHFHNLCKWNIVCEAQSTGLDMRLGVNKGIKVLLILHLQKLKTSSLPMTVELRDENKTLVDNAWFEIKHIPIASAHLWFSRPVIEDQREDSSAISLSYNSSVECSYSEEMNTEK